MTRDVSKSLNKLSINIVGLQLLALVALIISVTATNSYMKHQIAEQMLLAARNDFLTGDFRQAILRMESANKGHFTAIGYSEDGKKIFIIPSSVTVSVFDSSSFLNSIWNAHILKSVSFSSQKTSALGDLDFIYHRFSLLHYGLVLWGVLLILTLPLWFRARNKLIADYEKEIIFQEQKSKTEIAQQVAHDIKSPLSALTVLQQDLIELPEEKRLLLRSAVQRIHDIANDLSSKKKPDESQAENLSPQLLSGIIESLVSEKRLQHRSRMNVGIEADLGAASYGLFAKVQLREFKRVLSNLVNNAVEALGEAGGIVTVSMSQESGHGSESCVVRISDNGKGISADVLPKLMQRGETHGKEGGSGLRSEEHTSELQSQR